jgi:alkanesulfonate monooxygenase SsuD/methylene tetrahydromethanopterin reductase-like flavin-dependent oxidoreductase (luciferase family)
MASGNANPIGVRERFWEAIDLIGKTLTSHDGPFSWEGKHFSHRHVNIWPGPYQRPYPPMWAATSDPEDTAELGRRGMVNIMVMRGVDVTKRAWASYRQARAEAGLSKPATDRFGYSAFVYVGDTDEEGVRVGSKLLWFVNTSMKSAPQYAKFLPGADPLGICPAALPQRRCGDRDRAAWARLGVEPAGGDRRNGNGRRPHVCRQPGHSLQPDHGIL